MRTVLIVDDSTTARHVVRQRLVSVGYTAIEFIEAKNGRAALDELARHTISLVLTDIDMPEMDGVQLITAMRAKHAWQRIPVIIISAMEERTKSELEQLGVHRILDKPAFEDDLRTAVGALFPIPG